MKKALIAGNIVLLGIVVVMSGFLWGPSHGKATPPPDYNSCYECSRDSFYGLTIQEFMRDIARYRTTHAYRINHEPYMMSHDSLKDTRACWYSLDTLEKYICLIKKYSEKQGLASSTLGIRFYYAVYPSNPGQVWNGRYISRHTLFMVPTHQMEVQEKEGKKIFNVDFDPRLGLDPLANYFAQVAQAAAAGTPQPRIMVLDLGHPEQPSEMAKNQGQLCPPNCPPGVLNTLAGIDQTYSNVTYEQ